MSLLRTLVPLFLLASFAPSPALAQDWNPSRTFVLVVGVLEWQDSESFASFPQPGRRDALLVTHFHDRGVPPDQVVYLKDRQATTARVEQELAALLARTRPGDFMLVYYAGHGFKDGRETLFATWDAGAGSKGWRVSALVAAVEAGFRGTRVLLVADCCYSGALAREIRGRRAPFAALASSSASELSTGNWTFTEGLLDALRGEPWIDRDRDGSVSLEETGASVVRDMAFAEGQRATWFASAGFGTRTVLAKAGAPRGRRIGDLVDARSGGTWWHGRIVDEKGARFRVHYFGYQSADDEWVAAADIRDAAAPRAFAQGARVQVEWKKRWYPAVVREERDGVHLIHYDGYDADWDEWVSPKRIKAR